MSAGVRGSKNNPRNQREFMSLKKMKGKETRKPRTIGSSKAVASSRNVARLGRGTAPKLAVKTTLKSPAKTVIKVAAVKPETKPAPATRPAIKVAAAKVALKAAPALKPVVALKPERIHSHPTMCLHCHLIVEMFHERGADPVKGAWQCPRCGHKYLFSHWKIKRQARSKSEAS
jgi:DNA-directed RNA polymerase subunit RPC12/RpoP